MIYKRENNNKGKSDLNWVYRYNMGIRENYAIGG
jgi:hypothetical protein